MPETEYEIHLITSAYDDSASPDHDVMAITYNGEELGRMAISHETESRHVIIDCWKRMVLAEHKLELAQGVLEALTEYEGVRAFHDAMVAQLREVFR